LRVVTSKRGNGEGSIYQRSSDGLWRGAMVTTDPESGQSVRRYVSGKTRAAAVEKLRRLRQAIDEGGPAPGSTITVNQLFTRWYADVLRHQVAASASSNYLSVATNHILPTLGAKRVAQVTTADVDRLLSHKLDAGLSVSTVQRIRSVMAQAIGQAMRWGWVSRNVATLARAPRSERREGRSLTPEQARALLSSLAGRRNQPLYALMLATGLRRGEALGLQWRDLDVEKSLLRVRRQLKWEGGSLVTSDTKTSRSRRTVNLPFPMVRMLEAHRCRQEFERSSSRLEWPDTGFIFTTSRGTPIDPRNLYREFQQIARGAGLGTWHPHELRHSAASLMLAQGVKLHVVSELLGHASIRMTADVYGHVLNPDREAAADAMGDLLWGSVASREEGV
jgi:integrase